MIVRIFIPSLYYRELTGNLVAQRNDQLVLERLHNTYRPWGFGLIIENAGRPTVIEFMGFLGLSEDDKQKIFESHERITNEIAESASDDDITFLFDEEDEDDSFLFKVMKKRKTKFPRKV